MIDPTVEADDVLCIAAVQDCLCSGKRVAHFSWRAWASPHVTNITISTRAPSENCDMAAPRLTPNVKSTRVRNHLVINAAAAVDRPVIGAAISEVANPVDVLIDRAARQRPTWSRRSAAE